MFYRRDFDAACNKSFMPDISPMLVVKAGKMRARTFRRCNKCGPAICTTFARKSSGLDVKKCVNDQIHVGLPLSFLLINLVLREDCVNIELSPRFLSFRVIRGTVRTYNKC